MGEFKATTSIPHEEQEQIFQRLVDEVNEITKPVTAIVAKIPAGEWWLPCSGLTLDQMEQINTAFRRHECSYITYGGQYPVLRMFCDVKREKVMTYHEPKKQPGG